MPGMYKTIEGSNTGSSDGNDSPPPGGNIRVAVQPWAPSGGRHHGNHVRSDSIDSLDSNSSGSSGFNHTRQLSGDSTEYIPTRNIPKAVTQPSHNPLRFVKVQSSSLYLKAEEQIKLTKEVKITRHSLRDEEEEWQTNLSSWKSRRKQQSEKVIQRAEVMREIETEEQRLQQQRKVKTFSEMMEERANKPRTYNFAIYSSENEERADSRSGYVADKEDKAASASDCYPSESETDPGSEEASYNACDHASNADENGSRYKYCNREEAQSCSYREKILMHSYIKDDSEICSSEEEFVTERKRVSELGLSVVNTSTDSGLESLGRSGDVGDSVLDFGHDNGIVLDKTLSDSEKEMTSQSVKPSGSEDSLQHAKTSTSKAESATDKDLKKLQIWLKHSSDLRGFGFTLRGGKDQGTPVFVDSVVKGGASDIAGLRVDDEIKEINGESCFGRCHSALVFAVKQAVYTGQLDLVIKRSNTAGTPDAKDDSQPQIISRRGSAFAQKIAMFNSNADSHSSQESLKCEKQDLRNKGESFVLRRRSTFETATKKEEMISNRWSTSFSRDSHYGGSFTVQDRKHSFESLANIDHSVESKPIRKLPPPVPAKPKNKMSVSIESLPDSAFKEPYTLVVENSEKAHHVENVLSPQHLEVSTCPSILISSPILGGKTLDVSDSESNDIALLPQDNNVKSLKELCEDCKQTSFPFTHQKHREDNELVQNEEKPQELCNDVNGENESSNVIKPCGYSVISEGNLNIVYDSHSDTNTDRHENCQKNVSHEAEFENECSDACVNITPTDELVSCLVNNMDCSDNQLPIVPNNNVEMQHYNVEETAEVNKEVEKIILSESRIIPESSEVIRSTLASDVCSIPNDQPAVQEQYIENFIQQCPEGFTEDEPTILEPVETIPPVEDDPLTLKMLETLAPVDAIAEQMELMILNQLAEANENVEISSAELALCMNEQQSLLNDFDTLPRQFEPPKEKPPPPPPEEETESLKITVTSVARANSTKRIKQEIQKRRSDFLGLEVHDGDINIDDYILPPVAVEDILRSEVELKLTDKPLLISHAEGDEYLEEQHLNSSQTENYEAFVDNTEEVIDTLHQTYNADDLNSDFISPKETCSDNYEERLSEDMFTTEQLENSLNAANTLETAPDCVPLHEALESVYDDTTKDSEAPQPIKRQHLLLSLGAAPKAKIIHENEWIKQNEAATVKRQSMPLLEGSIYDTAPWDKENGQNKNEITSSERKMINDRCALPPLTFEVSNKHPPAPPPKPGSTTSPISEDVSNSDQGSSQTVHYVISPVSDSSEDSDSISAPGYTWNYEQIQPPDSREMSEHQQPKPNEVCGVCSKELGYGEVIVIDSVLFPYHSDCFNCSICNTELNSQANVQFLNNTLACQTCVDTRTAVKSSSPGESSSRL